MTLNPTFSVTPLTPNVDSPEGSLLCFRGRLTCQNVNLGIMYSEDTSVSYTLADQFKQNKACFRNNMLLDPLPTEINFGEIVKYSSVWLTICSKATETNQYLLIFHVFADEVYNANNCSKAVFYVNGNLVYTADVNGEQFVALLLDCPSQCEKLDIIMFHGGVVDSPLTLQFRGVECYII